MNGWLSSAIAALGVIAACPALAGDGRIEINQARALAGGVTPGDTPDFPVSLSVPGSYMLTSNLTVTDPADHGIQATVNGVTIDLNGFEVVGPVVCTGLGSAVSCSSGTGAGIFLSAPNSAVHDGRVRGFRSGVLMGNLAQIRRLIVESNEIVGISVGDLSIISETIAFQNGGRGIRVSNESLIEASVASSNQNSGFFAFDATVVGCAAHDNGSAGIDTGQAVIRDNSAYLNEYIGIVASEGSLVSDNAAYENGNAGISTFQGSTVQRNTVRANSGFGLSLSADASYHDNTISGNGGTVNSGVNMGANSCNGTTTCP